jgi:hypothetical protein
MVVVVISVDAKASRGALSPRIMEYYCACPTIVKSFKAAKADIDLLNIYW